MSRIVSPPFLRPAPDVVTPDSWEIHRDGNWQVLGEAVPDWDYTSTIILRRCLRVDQKAVFRECHLADGAVCGLSVMWHATGTNRRGAFTTVPIEADEITVGGELSGNELGDQLRLYTRLILIAADMNGDPLAPWRIGSILWQDQAAVYLEGEGSMFPVEPVDFGAAGIAVDAAWYLEWTPDEPERATLGALRLYVNTAHEVVRRAAANPGADEETRAITSAMRWDLLRQLIQGALDSGLNSRVDYPPGSLGETMKLALQIAFGHDDVVSVRALRSAAPSEFEARIQAASRVFRKQR